MKKIANLFLALIVSTMAFQVSAAAPVEVDRIVAVVNDEAITLFELHDRARSVIRQLQAKKIPLPPQEELERQLLERLIIDKVQIQYAKETGMRIPDNELDIALRRIAEGNRLSLADFRAALERDGIQWSKFREEIRDEMTVARLRDREVSSRVTVTEGEVDNYLASPEATQGGAEVVQLAHILIRVPEQASPDQFARIRSRAEQALQQLRRGDDFAKVAAAFSDAPDGLSGGDMGPRPLDNLPTLYADASKRLKPGGISEILRSPAGLHIIMLLERKGGEKAVEALRQTRARHILIKVSEVVSEAEAKRRIIALKERIDNGADFAELAKQHSNDTLSATKGGDLGWVYQGDTVPEFEKAMDALKIGELSQPVQSMFGWHIIQVQERKTDDGSTERQRLNAKAALRERKADEAYQDWLRQMRDRAYVEYRLEDNR